MYPDVFDISCNTRSYKLFLSLFGRNFFLLLNCHILCSRPWCLVWIEATNAICFSRWFKELGSGLKLESLGSNIHSFHEKFNSTWGPISDTLTFPLVNSSPWNPVLLFLAEFFFLFFNDIVWIIVVLCFV